MLNFTLNRKRVELILFVGALAALISFVLVMATKKNYKATTDILIVQNQQGVTDYYTLYKSSEYLSKVLTEAIYSEKFLDEIGSSGIISTTEFLPENKSDRLKDWKKIVDARRNLDFGMIKIEVADDTSRKATKISEAIVYVLTSKNAIFLGEGKNIEVKVISGPVVEKTLSGGEIAVVVGGGFLLGAFLLMVLLYYKDQAQAFKKERGAVSSIDYEENSVQKEAVMPVQESVTKIVEEKEAVHFLKRDKEVLPSEDNVRVEKEIDMFLKEKLNETSSRAEIKTADTQSQNFLEQLNGETVEKQNKPDQVTWPETVETKLDK